MSPTLLDDVESRRALIASLAEDDPFCPEPPAEAADAWPEARIRAFFAAGGVDAGLTESPAEAPTQLTKEQARVRCAMAACAAHPPASCCNPRGVTRRRDADPGQVPGARRGRVRALVPGPGAVRTR